MRGVVLDWLKGREWRKLNDDWSIENVRTNLESLQWREIIRWRINIQILSFFFLWLRRDSSSLVNNRALDQMLCDFFEVTDGRNSLVMLIMNDDWCLWHTRTWPRHGHAWVWADMWKLIDISTITDTHTRCWRIHTNCEFCDNKTDGWHAPGHRYFN